MLAAQAHNNRFPLQDQSYWLRAATVEMVCSGSNNTKIRCSQLASKNAETLSGACSKSTCPICSAL